MSLQCSPSWHVCSIRPAGQQAATTVCTGLLFVQNYSWGDGIGQNPVPQPLTFHRVLASTSITWQPGALPEVCWRKKGVLPGGVLVPGEQLAFSPTNPLLFSSRALFLAIPSSAAGFPAHRVLNWSVSQTEIE